MNLDIGYKCTIWGEWLSGSGDKENQFLVQTLLGTCPSLGTQSGYEVLWFLGRNCRNSVINIGSVRLSPREWPKVGRGKTK